MKIISIWNNKGGAGKTTTAYHLAQGLALIGRTVMVVDNDPQLTLSHGCMNIDPREEGMAQIYRGVRTIEEVAQEAEDISIGGTATLVVVPGNIEFTDIQDDLASGKSKLENFGKALESEMIRDTIDYVIIDNNPAFRGASEYSIRICDELFIPCPTSKTDFDGLLRTVAFVKRMGDEHLRKFKRLIPTIVKRTVVSKAYRELMEKNFPNQTVKSYVIDTADVPKVIDQGKVVYLHKYTTKYAQRMLSLISELFPEVDYKKTKESMEKAIEEKKIRRMFERSKRAKETPLDAIREHYTGKMESKEA